MPKKGFASVTLPAELVKRTKRVVKSPAGQKYKSTSEFIAEALEEKLANIGEIEVISFRDIPVEDAERLLLRYLETHPGVHYPSDIAFELGIDLETVFEAVKTLMKERRIETDDARREVIAR